MKKYLLLLLLLPISAFAQQSIVGTWKTIDDKTLETKSLVKITESEGVFSGYITELFNPSEPNPVCSKCQDERKDQAIEGMQIIRQLTKKSDTKWAGGKILDPKKGKEYKLKMVLQEEGTKLKVRGYIGSPMLGRTQFWIRAK